VQQIGFLQQSIVTSNKKVWHCLFCECNMKNIQRPKAALNEFFCAMFYAFVEIQKKSRSLQQFPRELFTIRIWVLAISKRSAPDETNSSFPASMSAKMASTASASMAIRG
jgi:hypothetical protein